MELALGQKGPISPPPSLREPYQSVAVAVASWHRVTAATHWHQYSRGTVDGVDFYIGERELGHIHLDGAIHLATNLALRNALVENRFSTPFPFAGYENWVMYSISSPITHDHALWLIGLNYDRLCGVDNSILLESINTHNCSINID